jgi:hypothetical protein
MPHDTINSEHLHQALLGPEKFSEWKRTQEVRKEFWRTFRGPPQRPLGANADEWNLFLSEYKDALTFLSVQIAQAIEQAEIRGSRLATKGDEHD